MHLLELLHRTAYGRRGLIDDREQLGICYDDYAILGEAIRDSNAVEKLGQLPVKSLQKAHALTSRELDDNLLARSPR